MKSLRFAVATACCAFIAASAFAETHKIAADENAQEAIQEALILAEPGDTVLLAAGHYDLTMGLSLDVDNITLKGAGIDKSILSFKNQDAGSEGLLITSSGCTLADFAIEDSKGDAIKTKGCKGVSFINVRTEWTGGPKPTNGAYGLYPVDSTDVLIDGCVAIGASDAGIYVGQSKNIIVRNSRAEYNVAGIEIENCYNADVYNCVAMHNTGGILVFDLPGLPQKGGHNVRVFDNKVVSNDTYNFAPPGNIVGNVARGTGIFVMANHNVEIFNNEIDDNQSFSILVTSYIRDGRSNKDPDYNPYPSGVNIHDNTIGDGGNEPDNIGGELVAGITGTPIPDIVWDGMVNPEWLKDGELAADRRIYVSNNGDATFVNLNLGSGAKGANAKPDTNIDNYKGSLPALKPIKIDGVK